MPRSNGRPPDRQPLVLEDVPQPSLPVCGFCGMSPAMIQTAFLNTPWGARLATFFCESCKAVFGVQVVAMEQPRQAEPLIMTPGEAFRP